MSDEELNNWFDANKTLLETAYLAGTTPWQQSCVGLRTPRSAQDWAVLLSRMIVLWAQEIFHLLMNLLGRYHLRFLFIQER